MHKKNFYLLLAALSTAAALLVATEPSSEEAASSAEEHIQPGCREIDPELREFTKHSRAKEQEEEEVPFCTKAVNTSEKQFKLAPALVESLRPLLAAYPFHIDGHSLKSIADDDLSLELEDGSHWKIPSSEAAQLRKWKRGEAISITPNYNWFSSYSYYITNKSNGTYVKANMSMGPVAFGPQSHWVVDLDLFGGRVYLENNMLWHVDPKDRYLLKDWSVNDHLILGTYDSWISPCDHILINVNLLEHVRVRQN